MFKGIVFALSACLIWALCFVVPQMMESFSSFEIAIGRYTFYAMISFLIFFKFRFQGTCRYSFSVWLRAIIFSLLSTFAYYVFVILSLRYSTPAICTLILGISPVAIAFYGNWREKECSYRSLLLPSLFIFLGLIIINIPQLKKNGFAVFYLLGIACSLLALVSWCVYVVANARFLKRNQNIHSSDWSTLIGVSSFFWVIVFAVILGVFFKEQLSFEKFFVWNTALKNYLMGSAILGFLCSWVGSFLWNRASCYLPVSLAGQLTIFEIIFGLLLIYLLEQRLPPLMEVLGMLLFLLAIVYGIRSFSKTKLPISMNS